MQTSTDKDFFENNTLLKNILNKNIESKEIPAIVHSDEKLEEYIKELESKPILSGRELMLLPKVVNTPLIDGVLYKGDVVILVAREKAGKSILSMQMACALTSTESFLGQHEVLEESTILYIQSEGHINDFIDRLKRMTSETGVKWNPDKFYHMCPPALALDEEIAYDSLITNIDELGLSPNIIFLDPLYMSMNGSLRDDDTARKFCRHVRELQHRYNATIIIVHHENRGKSDQFGNKLAMGDNAIYGSFVWKAFPSHIFLLVKNKDDSRVLTCETQRTGEIVDKVNLKLFGKTPLKFTVTDESSNVTQRKIISYVSSSDDGTSISDIVDGVGVSVSTVRRTVSELVKTGKLYVSNEGHYPILYKGI